MFRYFLFASLLVALFPAHAIVNLESLHIGLPEEGVSGSLQLGINGAEGNSRTTRASFGSRVQQRHQKTTRFVALNTDYGNSFGVEDKNKSFLHIRQIEQISQSLAWEAYTQAERNKFARLNFRGLAGGGARFTLGAHTPDKAIFFGLGGFYSREVLDSDGSETEDTDGEFYRLNTYFVFKRKLASGTVFMSTSYFQPSIEDAKDFRFLEDASLLFKFTENTQFRITLNLFHDNRPAERVKKTDVDYSTSFVYRF
ncbi:MAG: DUF481 domain-containing protein [Gammaproteobacteria bacterium]|nr:DUF481 domain-containing protein [Gammaproteobacteria bacterium]MDH5691611.1 DUF481 domain-containing protein [Gammaproteobacteria bacterium]